MENELASRVSGYVRSYIWLAAKTILGGSY